MLKQGANAAAPWTLSVALKGSSLRCSESTSSSVKEMSASRCSIARAPRRTAQRARVYIPTNISVDAWERSRGGILDGEPPAKLAAGVAPVSRSVDRMDLELSGKVALV